jgi:hypothetical protein
VADVNLFCGHINIVRITVETTLRIVHMRKSEINYNLTNN